MLVLPEPVLPMMAVVWPGNDVNEMFCENRMFGAGVAEPHIAHLQAPALPHVSHRSGWRGYRTERVEHLLDALR